MLCVIDAVQSLFHLTVMLSPLRFVLSLMAVTMAVNQIAVVVLTIMIWTGVLPMTRGQSANNTQRTRRQALGPRNGYFSCCTEACSSGGTCCDGSDTCAPPGISPCPYNYCGYGHYPVTEAQALVWNSDHSCDFTVQFRSSPATSTAFGACSTITNCTINNTYSLALPTMTSDVLCNKSLTNCTETASLFLTAPTITSDRVCAKLPHASWVLLPFSDAGGQQSFTRTVTIGVSHSGGYNISASWGKIATDAVGTHFTAGAGFSLFGLGVTASASHDHTDQTVITQSIAQSYSSTFSETTTTTQSHTFAAAGSHWHFQWQFEYSNGSAVTVLTQNFATTPNGYQPCCFPNYFADDTTPQSLQCLPVVSGAGIVLGPSPELCPSVASKSSQESSSFTGVIVGCIIAVIVVAIVGVLLLRRMFKTRDFSYSVVMEHMYKEDSDDEIAYDQEASDGSAKYDNQRKNVSSDFCEECGEKCEPSKFCPNCGIKF